MVRKTLPPPYAHEFSPRYCLPVVALKGLVPVLVHAFGPPFLPRATNHDLVCPFGEHPRHNISAKEENDCCANRNCDGPEELVRVFLNAREALKVHSKVSRHEAEWQKETGHNRELLHAFILEGSDGVLQT